jgi:hypothetical protein
MSKAGRVTTFRVLCVEDQRSEMDDVYLPLLARYAQEIESPVIAIWCDAAPELIDDGRTPVFSRHRRSRKCSRLRRMERW